jgi:rhomboid protease GluP
VINLIVFAIMIATGVHIMSPKIVDLLAWGANYAPETTGGEWCGC